MPVQMLVGGVEIQMRLSGSAAVADGPYSFSSRFALMSTFSPGAIAGAAPLMFHTSLNNSDGDCAKTSEVSDRPTRAARIRLIMRAIIQRPQNGPDSQRDANLSRMRRVEASSGDVAHVPANVLNVVSSEPGEPERPGRDDGTR